MIKKKIVERKTIQERLQEKIDERIKLLDYMCRKERERGIPSQRGEWLLVFECLQYLFGKIKGK